jgi:hypothetical protein
VIFGIITTATLFTSPVLQFFFPILSLLRLVIILLELYSTWLDDCTAEYSLLLTTNVWDIFKVVLHLHSFSLQKTAFVLNRDERSENLSLLKTILRACIHYPAIVWVKENVIVSTAPFVVCTLWHMKIFFFCSPMPVNHAEQI